MYNLLSKELSRRELLKATKLLVKKKAPRPDGINIKFYTQHRATINPEYLQMVNQSLMQGKVSQGMTKGLISLIFKSECRDDLANWRPITLLNTSYKILAKALQLRIKLILGELIDSDQIACIQIGPFQTMC